MKFYDNWFTIIIGKNGFWKWRENILRRRILNDKSH